MGSPVAVLPGYHSCKKPLTRAPYQDYDALGFRVLSEDALDKELLVSKIFEEEVFQRQGTVRDKQFSLTQTAQRQ